MGIANCPATCGECQACADSTTWTDDWGGDCASHSGNKCNDFTNCCGWSESQQDDLIANCPATCGECQASDDGDDDDKANCGNNKNEKKCGKNSQCEWKNKKCVEAKCGSNKNEKKCGKNGQCEWKNKKCVEADEEDQSDCMETR